MNRTSLKRTRLWIGFLCLAAGCHEPAARLSEAGLQDTAKMKAASGTYWGQDTAKVPPTGYRKVVLLEFAVEYVTEKLESLADHQPGVVIHEFIPIGLVTSLAGAGRIRIQLEEELRKDLPNEMFRHFEAQLRAEGLELVSQEKIRSAAAYQKLTLGEPGHTDLAHAFNVAGTDVGVPRLLVIEPAEGFDVILGAKDGRNVEDVEKELIREVGADAALRARFRVSVYRQFASIEKWSILRVTMDGSSGFHFAARSLLSDETVVSKEDFLPVAGIIKQIDPERFRAAIQTLYPPYLTMAAQVLTQAPFSTVQSATE